MVEPGDIATWAAAGVAVVAAGFTGWQTREARKSRIAAQTQATEAAKSRRAAETQARAAEEQVALMRADRDERDAPVFAVSAVDSYSHETNFFAVKIMLRMERGHALGSLTITASGDYLSGGLQSGPDQVEAGAGEITVNDVRDGSEIVLYAQTEDGYVGKAVNIDVVCHERYGGRAWPCHYVCTIGQRPPRSRIY